MKKRLLVVEDDRALARVVSDTLTFAGFEVQCVADGEAALRAARDSAPDLILLDVMLPGCSGFDLCGVLRQSGRTPIIMLTARTQKADKLQGLELGADDYITKPFHFEELVARIDAVLRRVRPTVDSVVVGPVTVDFSRRRALTADGECHLTHREFELLHYLAERAGRVVSRGELLRAVWGYLEAPQTRAVDYAIIRLRRKLERDPREPRFIHTVHGDGYCLTVDDADPAAASPERRPMV